MTTATPSLRAIRHASWVDRSLLACGVAYGLVYVVTNDVIAAWIYGGYSATGQAVSELSAVGSPARPFLVTLTPVYSALLIAFGIGVYRAARGWAPLADGGPSRTARRLRWTGVLLTVFGALGPVWLFFPMSQRELLVGESAATNDVGHIVLTVASVGLITAAIVACSVVFGRRFRVYSWLTIAVTVIFGLLTGLAAAGLERGEATPSMGLLERVSMGAWFLWLAVVAVLVLQSVVGYRHAQPPLRQH